MPKVKRPWNNVALAYLYGGVSLGEGLRLSTWAARVPAGQVIVEIGAMAGTSSGWLAAGAHKAGNGVHTYCVDLWDRKDESTRNPMYSDPSVRQRWLAHMAFLESGGLLDRDAVHAIRGTSVEIASGWKFPIGLLHIDALHTYDACTADIEAWTPHVASGGVVVVHDYNDARVGTRQAVDDSPHLRGYKSVKTYKWEYWPRRRGQWVGVKP